MNKVNTMPDTRIPTGRICLISTHGYVGAEPQLGKPDTGGQVVYVLEVAKALCELGCTVDLVTRQFEGQPEIDEINENCRVLRIPFGGEAFIVKENFHDIIDEFSRNFLAYIKEHELKYDLISSHYWDAGVGGQQVAEALAVPHVHTPHSLGAWKKELMQRTPDAEMSKYRFEERISAEQKMYQTCHRMIGTTHQQADRISDFYNIEPEKITVLPAGLDDKKFNPVDKPEIERLREKHNMRPHDVLALGRMARNKGYDLLIKALPHLLEFVPDARLILCVGHDESEQDQKQIAALKAIAEAFDVYDHIEWRGYVSDEELPEVYRAAGVYALPSRYEPFGMTAIEAMACGTPTVITVRGGLKESTRFGTHTLWADPERPVELAHCLALPLLYDAIAEDLHEHGTKFAVKNFAWTGICTKMLKLFNRVIAEYHRDETMPKARELSTGEPIPDLPKRQRNPVTTP